VLPRAGATRTLRLEAQYNGSAVSAEWLNRSVALRNDNGAWRGELPLDYWQRPGVQDITVSAGGQNVTIPVTVLELRAVRAETKRVELRAAPGRSAEGAITVRNIGNVPATVSWAGNDLRFGAQSIAFENLDVEGATIAPAEAQDIAVSLRVPEDAAQGKYRTVIRMETV
jgi:hypothetical protein